MTAPPEGYTFTAELWQWDAKKGTAEPGSWCLISVPLEVSAAIRDEVVGPPRGFGSVRVEVEAGSSTWTTSVFPDSTSGGFVLPIKKAVQRKERVSEGDELTVTLRVAEPG